MKLNNKTGRKVVLKCVFIVLFVLTSYTKCAQKILHQMNTIELENLSDKLEVSYNDKIKKEG